MPQFISSYKSGIAQFGQMFTASVQDTIPPTVPTNLTSSSSTTTSISITWSASTDISGVGGYYIFRNGVNIGNTLFNVLSFTDTNLTPYTDYSYSVAAYDINGYTSNQCAAVVVKTQAESSNNHKGVVITLYNNGILLNNLSDVNVYLWKGDVPYGSANYEGVVSTNSLGEIRIDLQTYPVFNIGDPCFLLVYKLDSQDYSLSKTFVGRIIVGIV